LGTNGLISFRTYNGFQYLYISNRSDFKLHHINFKLGDLPIWVKKKSQEENRFKSLFNIVNRLNANTKVSKQRRKNEKVR
jgi:hypothetical protein